MKTRGLIAAIITALLSLAVGLTKFEVFAVPEGLMSFIEMAGSFLIGLVLKSPIGDKPSTPSIQ